jgi:histidine ammonia-lyase
MNDGHARVRMRGTGLRIDDVVAVARHGVEIDPLEPDVSERMEASYAWIQSALESDEQTVYGVNTGYGSLASHRIANEEVGLLSRNVILKCAVGVGEPLPDDCVRAMLLVRANSLAKGVSGIRPAIVESLVEMLNRGVTPRVPSKGSLGASGDLAPLAHIAAVATRGPESMPVDYSGEAWYGGELLTGDEAMRRAGIPRLVLEAKEGLALTNGTSMMVAAGALAVHDAKRVLAHAEIAAALSLEGLRAISEALHPSLHDVNGQPGQVRTAARLRSMLAGSRLIDSDPDRVQDAYSVRCTPQVLGPIHDMLAFIAERMEAAMNAASDNPLIFVDRADSARKAISGGNFHGAGPALWLDVLGIALAEAANISDRRVFRLLTPELSGGLPAMLAPDPGLNGGLMSAQYTAAALVSDNKTLAHPDSVDSVPTSANQEDHVSMGANAARRALEIVENVRYAIAVELLAATQAIYLREDGPARLGQGTTAAYAVIRERVEPVVVDRALAPDIETLAHLIEGGALLDAVEEALGAPLA